MSTLRAPHPSPTRLRLTAAIALLGLLSASAGCIIVHDDGPVGPGYSPIDYDLASPPNPAIDAHFNRVFSGVACVTSGPNAVSWEVTLNANPARPSGRVPCWDSKSSIPYAVRFQDLAGDTSYTLQATGYVGETATWQASCSAVTRPGAVAVLPSCSVTRIY